MSGFAGRALAVACSMGLPAIALWQLSDPNSIPFGVFCIACGVIIGLIEIPFLCACFKWCKCFAGYMKWVAGWYIVRGIIYVGLSAGGYAIYKVQSQNLWMLLGMIALTIAGTLMFVAKVRREEDPIASLLEERRQTAAAETAKTSGGGGGGGFFGGFLSGAGAAKVQNAAATAAVGAATKTAGEQLFGAKDEEAALPSAASTFGSSAAAAPKKDDKAAMFSGGSLFGGPKGKYGYGEDAPEANPFFS